MKVHIDFESRSTVDLKKTGVDVYAQAATTEIIVCCWAIDDGPVKAWRHGQPWPTELGLLALDGAEFNAWNAGFESTMWRHTKFLTYPEPEQWHCTMALAALHGLPLGLAQACQALGLEQTKDMVGNRLMLKMAKPRKVVDGFAEWWGAPQDWDRLVEYCKRDVIVEREIARRLHPMPNQERQVWLLDQKINRRGVRVDGALAFASRRTAQAAIEAANRQLDQITSGKVSAVTKVKNLLDWVRAEGVETDTLSKQQVAELLEGDIPARVGAALEVRKEAAKSSVAKLDSMLAYGAVDGRMRGLLQYSGAATGRWSGRGCQPQNFPRGEIKNPEALIPLVLKGDLEGLSLLYPPMVALSAMLRAHLIASSGCRLIAGDYAAIEARVLAWLAGETSLLELFHARKDPYVAMAAKVYKVDESKVGKPQRQMGKQAILGLGYQMGAKTFIDTCATYQMVVEEDFAVDVVRIYRDAHPRIVAFWRQLQDAALDAVANRCVRPAGQKIVFDGTDEKWLRMQLPSGRYLYYANPRIIREPNPFTGGTRPVLVTDTVQSKTRKWGPRKMYGGLWAENATQATARDLLADAMLRLEDAGYPVVLTVHDEIVCDVPDGRGTVEDFERLMRECPKWAEGCPVEVEAWEGQRYRK